MSRTRIEDNGFRDWLRQVIQQSGISRKEAAVGIGVSPGTIDSWIGGWRRIGEENLREVAVYFNTPLNVVRELAGYEPVSRTAPGTLGLRGVSGVKGVTSVVFIPIIGSTPSTDARLMAGLGDIMPFAAEYTVRFREPGIVMVGDDMFAHRGIQSGEALLIEQDIQAREIQPGNLVVLEVAPETFDLYVWFTDEGGGVTLVPASGHGAPRSYDPEAESSCLRGLVRNVYSIRSVDSSVPWR